MSDYIKFSELNLPLQLSVIDAYSAMLFDFDTPIWYEQIPAYQQLDYFCVQALKEKPSNALQILYKTTKQTTLGEKTVILRVPEVRYIPQVPNVYYPKDGIRAAIMEGDFELPALGILNHTQELFYASNDVDDYSNLLQEKINNFKEAFQSYRKDYTSTRSSFSMKKKIPLENGLFPDAMVDLDIFTGLGAMEETIENPCDDYFYFGLSDVIHSHTSGEIYMKKFMEHADGINDLFNQDSLAEYLTQREEYGDDNIFVFYVLNKGGWDMPLNKDMRHPTSAIPLTPYINRAAETMVKGRKYVGGTIDVAKVWYDYPEAKVFASLDELQTTLIESIKMLVDTISTVLSLFQDSMRKEISRRMTIGYFSEWADEKGLTFNMISGEMKTSSKNP